MSKRNSLHPNTGEQLLMIGKYGGEDQSRGSYTSFLCGTMLLHSGDELFVRVSNTSFVYKYYFSNYFGLYEI